MSCLRMVDTALTGTWPTANWHLIAKPDGAADKANTAFVLSASSMSQSQSWRDGSGSAGMVDDVGAGGELWCVRIFAPEK